MSENRCSGCYMEGKTNVLATHSFEEKTDVQGPCPDAYEYSLKGQSCLVLHWKTEIRQINLCDRHYEMHKQYRESSSITHR